MKTIYLHTGLHLTLDKIRYRINKIIEGNICYLENIVDHSVVIRSKDEILLLLQNDSTEFAEIGKQDNVGIKLVTGSQNPLVMKRYEYVRVAQSTFGLPRRVNLEDIINKVSIEIDDDNPPSSITELEPKIKTAP